MTWKNKGVVALAFVWLAVCSVPAGASNPRETPDGVATNPDFSKYEKKFPWKPSEKLIDDLASKRSAINYHEAKVRPYTLPEVLALTNGEKVTTTATWEQQRRGELLELFRRHVYGFAPPKPDTLTFRIVESDPKAMNGRATLKRVAIRFQLQGEPFTFHLTLFIPNQHQGKAPVFLLLNHRSADNTDPTRKIQSEFWPAEYAIERGYAMAAINVAAEVEPDNAKATTGIRAFYRQYSSKPEELTWGALSAWAWSGSRAVDYFETDPDIDASKIAVIGHSRGGKTSLWAGAQDTRFALVCVNDAGEGGPALSRRNFGEDNAAINKSFPYWFAPQYATYAGKENALPVDQHELVALVAPRGYHGADAAEDLWADPRGSWLSLVEASRVWALYGQAAVLKDPMPLVNDLLLQGPMAYHIRQGGHGLTMFDWKLHLDHADMLFKKAAVSPEPIPATEERSKDYVVQVQGRDIPVYVAKVAPADPARRWKAMDDKVRSAEYFDKAAFAYFDMSGPVMVAVTCPEPITSVRVLPSSFKIVPTVQGQRLTFSLTEPKPVTIEVNGNWVGALHLLANPPETSIPRPDDPNVIYFGPGIHEIAGVTVGSGKTVYIAAGAVVKGTGERRGPVFTLQGERIVLRGRGVIDGSLCPTHARNLLLVRGKDITVEGIIFRDSSVWTIPVRQSERVTVKNVKLLGYRANSDGIDICNSRDVTVEGCFIRTLDDLIVVKADKGQGPTGRIVARKCVLWNEVAHALSVGAEIREDVDDVLFDDCDVIHDKGREWTLRVFHCDSARVRNIRFENLRIEESPRLISLWIGKFVWTRDQERGHIQDVTFKNIAAVADPLRIELTGFDETHAVTNVLLQDVRVNGRPLTQADLKTNKFVRNVRVNP